MPGRGDNNKHGSAGQGSSNQRNQPFAATAESEPKSNHTRHATGGTPSQQQEKTKDTGVERDTAIAGESINRLRADEKTLNLVVDDVPYLVKAAPFSFNGETRFYVSVNDGPDHVFTWDSEVGQLRAIDDAAGILPDPLEDATSRKLQSYMKK